MSDISPKVVAGAFGAAVSTVFWIIAVATFWKDTFSAEQLSALVGSTGLIVGTLLGYLVRDPARVLPPGP